MLGACVQPPVFKQDGYAFIRSNYPIVEVNREVVEPLYRLDLVAGETTLVIVYNTYQHDYYCTFSWTAEPGIAYEVTDQENQYPLTLYRWDRTNSMWASRLDLQNPQQCIRKPRRTAASD
jgi:hypothetical protein